MLPEPWSTDRLELSDGQRRHLERVLRVGDGTEVTYTDGAGRAGRGRVAAGLVVRGEEAVETRDVPDLIVAAVPLRDKQRSRFLVEKLAELGVAELRWIRSAYGQVPPTPKAQAWADQALEQSRSAWRMIVTEGDPGALPGPIVVADVAGRPWPDVRPRTVVIGPEGGWSADDLQPEWIAVTLSPRVLRSETAAVVAAAQLLAGGPKYHNQ